MATLPAVPADGDLVSRPASFGALDGLVDLATDLTGDLTGTGRARITVLGDPAGGAGVEPGVVPGVVTVSVPLHGPAGDVVGALEIVDDAPREVPAALVALLTRVAAVVSVELDVARQFGDLDGDRQRWQLAVEAGGVGSFDWDLLTDRLDWDDQLRALFGYLGDDDYVPHIDSFTARLHPEDVPPTQAAIAEAVATSGRYRAEYRVVWPDGTVRWVQARGQVTRDVDARPVRMLGVAFDVTEAHQARSLARRTRDRLGMLAGVSAALDGRRDVEAALARLPQVVVPRLADFCIVSLVGPDGSVHDVGSHHRDPALAATLASYCRHRHDGLDPAAWAVRPKLSGRMVTVPFPAWENVLPLLGNATAKRLLTELAPAFVLAVPLRVRDEVVGILTLLNEGDGGPFGSSDQQVAAEVASRAAVAVDAARTFQRQRGIAEALQRSLLTAPPPVPPWQVSVRYVPSMDDVQVGGDWYDAFALPDGSLVVTVGDVMGHDSAAAARMGQLRSMLRGIFYATSADPARALTVVDDAMARIGLTGSATVVAARLHPAPDGGADVTWSLAGHPPPLVVGPARSRLLSAPVDPPLGVRADIVRREQLFHLAPDETLLCYTDGLIERRDEDIDVGLARLRRVGRAVGPDPDVLCDAVLSRLARTHDDDVVTLAVRCDPRAPGA